ncbi:MAG TPA: TetR/AcrR family transcriptional regulator [Caulobacteraceae bacterium]
MARRAQLIDAAGVIALEQGHLPIAPERLSQAVGASKALLYVYFPTQHLLFNGVLARCLGELAAARIHAWPSGASLRDASQHCASLYFDHVAANGPLIHLILRDPYMAGRIDTANRTFRDRTMRRLAHAARRELTLTSKEIIAAINLVLTIPEQAGSMAWRGEMERAAAKALCSQLVASSLAALAPDAFGGSPRAR